MDLLRVVTKKQEVFMTCKADLHPPNVSRATDTIRWRIVFFNLHLR